MAKNSTHASGVKTGKISMRVTLILFALIPLVVSSVIISIAILSLSSKEVQSYTRASFEQVICDVGDAFDSMTEDNMQILKAFATAPIVTEALLAPDNQKHSLHLTISGSRIQPSSLHLITLAVLKAGRVSIWLPGIQRL